MEKKTSFENNVNVDDVPLPLSKGGDIDIDVGDDVHIHVNRTPHLGDGERSEAFIKEYEPERFDVGLWFERFVENLDTKDNEEVPSSGAPLRDVTTTRAAHKREASPSSKREKCSTPANATAISIPPLRKTQQQLKRETNSRVKKRSLPSTSSIVDEDFRQRQEAEEITRMLTQTRQDFEMYRSEMRDFKQRSIEERVSMRESMRDVLHQVASNHAVRMQETESELVRETAAARKYMRKCELLETEMSSLVQSERGRATVTPKRAYGQNVVPSSVSESSLDWIAVRGEDYHEEYGDLVRKMIATCGQDAAKTAAAEEWAIELERSLAAAKRENAKLRKLLKAGSKSVSICDEFCLFRFCKAHISTDELDDAPATKDKVKSKNLFASKESLARNMTRVVRAAARAARKGDGVYSTEVGNSSSSDIVAAATRSLEHQAACTSEDLANTSNEDVSLAQRKAIRDLLLTASPSNESTSHFSVSAMFGSSVAQSSTYSSVALHRRLDMYISELREFRKRIAARSRKSVESVKKIKRQWKFQQSQLRAWAREKFIPTFKKARELEIALCESEQEKIRTVSEAISDRIGMAVNLRRIYSVLSGPERSVFATQIDDSFFGAPSNIASEVASSKSSKAIAAELRKVNNILERDVKKYLARSPTFEQILDA
eukprot:g3180.t1